MDNWILMKKHKSHRSTRLLESNQLNKHLVKEQHGIEALPLRYTCFAARLVQICAGYGA
jgi:hypothetical protein